MREEKNREKRLRRRLLKIGYILKKNKVRNALVLGYDGYMIVNAFSNFVEAGSDPYMFSLSLDDVETFTTESEK